MKIIREDKTYIKKEKIDFTKIDKYETTKILKSKKILKNVIEKYIVNDFSFLFDIYEEAMKTKETVSNTYKNYQKKIRTIDCITLSKILQKKLEKININTYIITCKAKGFSNHVGDELIKEAHTFLLYPCYKDNKLFFVIYDPGFRILEPITFYNKLSVKIPYKNGYIQIKYDKNNKIYPYSLNSNIRMTRDFKFISSNIKWFFNPYEETKNIDDFHKYVFQAKFSYKIMRYDPNPDNCICIDLNIITKQLDLYTKLKEEHYYLKQIFNKTSKEIKDIIKPYLKKAKLNKKEYHKFIKLLRIIELEKASPLLFNKVLKEYSMNTKNMI